MFKLFMIIAGIGTGNNYTPQIHTCKLDHSMLNLKARVELGIGCSKVNGRYAYRNGKLKRIYNEALPDK